MTVLAVIIQVRLTIVRIMASPGTGVVVVKRGECMLTGSEMWDNLRHLGHTAHVPQTDVLVEGRHPPKHSPVREHAAEGEKQVEIPSGHRHTRSVGCRVGSGSGGNGRMAG